VLHGEGRRLRRGYGHRLAPPWPRLRHSPPACPRTVRLRPLRSLQASSPTDPSRPKFYGSMLPMRRIWAPTAF